MSKKRVGIIVLAVLLCAVGCWLLLLGGSPAASGMPRPGSLEDRSAGPSSAAEERPEDDGRFNGREVDERDWVGGTLSVRVVWKESRVPIPYADLRVAPNGEGGDVTSMEVRCLPAGRTDKDGVGRFPWPGQSIVIEVWKGGRRLGPRVLRRIEDHDRRLLVCVDERAGVKVRVVQAANGVAIGGVPVALRLDRVGAYAGVVGARSRLHATTSEETGVAWFGSVLGEGDSQVENAVALVDLPLLRVVEASVDLLTREQVTLPMPDTGRVNVRILRRGSRAPVAGVKLRMTAYRAEEDAVPIMCSGKWGRGETDENGEHLVRYVGTGVWIKCERIGSLASGGLVAKLKGPELAGETVELEILVESRKVAVTGVLVNEEGKPWADTIVQIKTVPVSRGGLGVGALIRQANMEGRVKFTVSVDEPPPSGVTFGRLDDNADVREAGYCSIDFAAIEKRVDLGNVVMDYGDLIAAGEVVGSSRQPVRSVVTASAKSKGGKPYPGDMLLGNSALAVDGRFAIHCAKGWGDKAVFVELLVHAVKGGTCTVRGRVGRDDWRITLNRKGWIRGSVRLNAGEDPMEYKVVVVRGDTGGVAKVDQDGYFELRGLEEGAYDVIVTLRSEDLAGRARTAYRVDNVAVREDVETNDSRLWNVALKSSLAAYQLRILDPSGGGVSGAMISAETGGPYAIRSDKDGRVTLRLPPGQRLRISKEGYAPWVGGLRQASANVVLLPVAMSMRGAC